MPGKGSNPAALPTAALLWLAVFLPSAAHAYVTYTQGSNTVRWTTSSVTFVLNNTNGQSGTATLLQDSMTTWNEVNSAAFTMNYSGTSSYDCTAQDGTRGVCWGDPGSGRLAVNGIWWDNNGDMIDSDITMCQSCDWSVYDIQSVLTHELGHTLPLDHPADTTATMYANIYANDTAAATLAQDDIDGITHLYPLSFSLPDYLNMTGVTPGSSSTTTYTFTFNTSVLTAYGLNQVTVSSVSLTGTDAAEFSLSNDTCTGASFTSSGGSCTVDITFTPTDSNIKTAAVSIAVNGQDSPNQVTLYGNNAGIVPTVGEWGLILILAGMLAAAMIRRQPYAQSFPVRKL